MSWFALDSRSVFLQLIKPDRGDNDMRNAIKIMDLRYCSVKSVERGDVNAGEYSGQLSGTDLLIFITSAKQMYKAVEVIIKRTLIFAWGTRIQRNGSYSASNLLGSIRSAWLARLLYAGTTSWATYNRASSPITGSSANKANFQRDLKHPPAGKAKTCTSLC